MASHWFVLDSGGKRCKKQTPGEHHMCFLPKNSGVHGQIFGQVFVQIFDQIFGQLLDHNLWPQNTVLQLRPGRKIHSAGFTRMEKYSFAGSKADLVNVMVFFVFLRSR